jgi:hypothetical protein
MADEHHGAAPGPADQKRELLVAAQAAVADARSRAAVTPRPPTSPLWRGVILGSGGLAGLVGLAVILLQPTWLAPPPPPPDPPAIRDASVRLTLVREAGRIEQYRLANGRLPTTPAEAGSPVEGLEYERSGDTLYTLSLASGGAMVTFGSRDSVGIFLGASLELVTRRGPQ